MHRNPGKARERGLKTPTLPTGGPANQEAAKGGTGSPFATADPSPGVPPSISVSSENHVSRGNSSAPTGPGSPRFVRERVE